MNANPYAILPSYIISSDLSDGEKIICAIIDGFIKVYGTCEITNEFIAEMLNIDKSAVSSRISRLYKKNVITNVGSKRKRVLKLAYIKPEVEITEVEEKETDNFALFWEIQVKKEAKAAALKHFKKLSTKKQLLAISAYKQYVSELKDTTYAVLGRTFLKDQYYLDDKYQKVEKTEKEVSQDQVFDVFFQKVLDLVAFSKQNPKIENIDFEKISQNEEAVFDDREICCLKEAVCDVAGLCDQAYSIGNLKNLLRTFW